MELLGGVLPTLIKNLNDDRIILIKRALLLKSKHTIICTHCIWKTDKETLTNSLVSYLGIFLTYSNKTETFPSNLDIQNDFSIMESLLID